MTVSGPKWTEQQSTDAVVSMIGKRLAEEGMLREVLDDLEPDYRQELEAAFDRHADHMRELGRPGW